MATIRLVWLVPAAVVLIGCESSQDQAQMATYGPPERSFFDWFPRKEQDAGITVFDPPSRSQDWISSTPHLSEPSQKMIKRLRAELKQYNLSDDQQRQTLQNLLDDQPDPVLDAVLNVR